MHKQNTSIKFLLHQNVELGKFHKTIFFLEYRNRNKILESSGFQTISLHNFDQKIYVIYTCILTDAINLSVSYYYMYVLIMPQSTTTTSVLKKINLCFFIHSCVKKRQGQLHLFKGSKKQVFYLTTKIAFRSYLVKKTLIIMRVSGIVLMLALNVYAQVGSRNQYVGKQKNIQNVNSCLIHSQSILFLTKRQ